MCYFFMHMICPCLFVVFMFIGVPSMFILQNKEYLTRQQKETINDIVTQIWDILSRGWLIIVLIDRLINMRNAYLL